MKNKILSYISDAVIVIAASAVFYYVALYFVKMYLGTGNLLSKGVAFIILVLLCYGLYLIFRKIFQKYQKR